MLRARAAIAGIGATDFSKDSGRSELRLAAEAVFAALDDAGLAPSEVDGMVTYTQDANQEIAVAREVGIGELSFFSRELRVIGTYPAHPFREAARPAA